MANLRSKLLRLVSYAAKLAEQLGLSVTAVSIGEVSEDELQKPWKIWCIKSL